MPGPMKRKSSALYQGVSFLFVSAQGGIQDDLLVGVRWDARGLPPWPHTPPVHNAPVRCGPGVPVFSSGRCIHRAARLFLLVAVLRPNRAFQPLFTACRQAIASPETCVCRFEPGRKLGGSVSGWADQCHSEWNEESLEPTSAQT